INQSINQSIGKILFLIFSFFLLTIFVSCNFTWNESLRDFLENATNKTSAKAIKREPGDVLWNDGTWSAREEVLALMVLPDGKKPIGILAFEKDRVPYCMGLAIGSNKGWAASGSTGYSTNITELQGDRHGKGLIDGSKALDILKAACSDYNETNYPAWYWAENFDSNGVLYKGNSTKGMWYIPTIYELKMVFDSKSEIDESLAKLNTLNTSACTANSLGSNYYWSSSQYVSDASAAWGVRFNSGTVSYYDKYSNNSVLVVQAFTY
ncbi:MAG: DUF1566 domain-containing protein, partial [Treponema sp.]|nr:DUF1566 domain-containing protein [Treponema sp.]